MPTAKAALITHPVRARILTALMGRQLTTQQIAHLLPDVPLPSLYRHVRTFAEAGIIKAVDEVRVNGALNKVYAVESGQTQIGPADTSDATGSDHLRYFTTFLNTLAETFRVYLEQETLDPAEDPIHSLMEPLYLRPGEYRQFREELNTFLRPWREKRPGGDRRRVVFAQIVLPDISDPPLS
jgi:hypothetical protein